MKIRFLEIFRDSFDGLQVPLQAALSWEWIKTKEEWTPKWKVQEMIDYADKIPSHCAGRAIIADTKYRILGILNKLDPVGVKGWTSDMKMRFLEIFKKSFDKLSIPLQAVLSWEWITIEKEWVPRWEIENVIKYADKIPCSCIGKAIISDEKYRIPEIINKIEFIGVKWWNVLLKSKFLNAFSGKTFRILSESPLFMSLLQDPHVKCNWTPTWKVENIEKYIKNIPVPCICRAIVSNEKYRKKKILEELDPIKVQLWNNYSQRLDFMNIFNGNSFEILPQSLIPDLMSWDETKRLWTPKVKISIFIKYFEKFLSRCIFRGLMANEEYHTEEIFKKITVDQVKEWKSNEQKEFSKVFKDQLEWLSREVKIELRNK